MLARLVLSSNEADTDGVSTIVSFILPLPTHYKDNSVSTIGVLYTWYPHPQHLTRTIVCLLWCPLYMLPPPPTSYKDICVSTMVSSIHATPLHLKKDNNVSNMLSSINAPPASYQDNSVPTMVSTIMLPEPQTSYKGNSVSTVVSSI